MIYVIIIPSIIHQYMRNHHCGVVVNVLSSSVATRLFDSRTCQNRKLCKNKNWLSLSQDHVSESKPKDLPTVEL